ncbi:Pre-mRNA-splicing factor slu7 [Lecanosticta acicola]|uniref:Pre-mRNA-splicing factor SLU7 n=1 Tax=Lecanosticta acicola TaxID=111012 RepID=A0AAI8YPM4_9PEZI|nr:Pre-mRNA-splicing factor slu7 [Lecanosticta acicola]
MPPNPAGSGKADGKTSKSNERNEYIPSFIAKKPFYIDDNTATDADYLEHQRLQSQKNHDPLATAQWYDRGSKKGPAATKYRKGACENCGSMSHKEKDCLQRKRKAGAKWTGKHIAADENVKDISLGWDAKRDRWNGFEASEYRQVIEEYNEMEEMKKRVAGEEDEGDRYEAESDMGRKQASSTRNLRLREDTAKYLVNLDLNSAKYDPKTRSMIDSGNGDPDSVDAGEGFAKARGDAEEFERAQTYAWETQTRGDKDKIHLQANPTEALLTRKRKAEEDIQRKEAQKKALTDKYGSQDGISKKRPVAAEVTSNERYVEYDERGKIKGEPERKEKSMYAEDVLINNHTSVWGSWWKDFTWGYACCHSTVKNSFCTGEEGKKALKEADDFSKGLSLPSAEESGNAQEVEKQEAWREEERQEEHVPNGVDKPAKQKMDESRRRLDEMKAGVTEEEMEKYRKERTNKDDPMAKMLGIDELVDT